MRFGSCVIYLLDSVLCVFCLGSSLLYTSTVLSYSQHTMYSLSSLTTVESIFMGEIRYRKFLLQLSLALGKGGGGTVQFQRPLSPVANVGDVACCQVVHPLLLLLLLHLLGLLVDGGGGHPAADFDQGVALLSEGGDVAAGADNNLEF